MRILITGGTVFVSKFVAEYFVKRGNEVYVMNRNTKPQTANVKLIECDRREINNSLRGVNFDVVIDVTAYNANDINSLLNGLESFKKFIMISSSAVYPETLALPFKETDKCGKNIFWGDYGTDKIAAENALLKRVPDAFILRPPYLYGEYNNIYREGFVFDCAEKNEPFYLPNDGSMPLQFFHVEDLCRFIEIILKEKTNQRIFNVGNVPVTVKEWVKECYYAVGKSPTFVNITDGTEQRNYFPFYDYAYMLDTTNQDKFLPRKITLEEGLKRAYKWYKDNKHAVKAKNYFEYINENFKQKY